MRKQLGCERRKVYTVYESVFTFYLFIYKSFDTVTTQPEPSVSVM